MHRLVLFCGSFRGLAALRGDAQNCQIFDIGGPFPVLPIEWLEEQPNVADKSWRWPVWRDDPSALTQSDIELVAAASRNGPIAYIETDYSGGLGAQSAAFWRDGRLIIDVVTQSSEHRLNEQSPINRVLRALGVVAINGRDEFSTEGLDRYRDNESIIEEGRRASI